MKNETLSSGITVGVCHISLPVFRSIAEMRPDVPLVAPATLPPHHCAPRRSGSDAFL